MSPRRTSCRDNDPYSAPCPLGQISGHFSPVSWTPASFVPIKNIGNCVPNFYSPSNLHPATDRYSSSLCICTIFLLWNCSMFVSIETYSFSFATCESKVQIIIEICIILWARLGWPRSSDTRMWIWVCEVCVCAAPRETDECNCSVVWKMLRQRECWDACKCISTKVLK